MDEFGLEHKTGDPQSSPPKWKGAPSIRLAQQLNEQCIDLFCELAIDSSPDVPWSLVASNRDLWIRLDATARKRLAVFPFVIVDVRFKDEAWWRSAGQERPVALRAHAGSSAMPSTRYDYLVLETLMFAWQVAREDRHVAQLVFAMTPAVADCIAALTMQHVRTIAVEGSRYLRIRWDDEPQFWRELLICAREGDEAALTALRRDAKLLFCGELIQVPSP
jgi:hypothetical protein